ncbi:MULTISPECIES: hypothetical protein [Pseudanabaena]|uniref:Uncharacterized protein n=2 Tax=Pseudanabaena TaxID=1152 RepID=L8MQM7_9CYAN|nr:MULTISPECIES: hypothetical protein [Pseudanabaena]ELS30207.1 hypothetical protein Pse7429DRAFT_4565 [Pseudanabaena biceps PCC 7429]MDG3497505.1 hypothetical protein [Pseudanabaena catenata USMAC16]
MSRLHSSNPNNLCKVLRVGLLAMDCDIHGNDIYGNDIYGNDIYGNDIYGNDIYGNDIYGKMQSIVRLCKCYPRI